MPVICNIASTNVALSKFIKPMSSINNFLIKYERH